MIFGNLRVAQKNSSTSDGSVRNDWAKQGRSEREEKKYTRREGNLSFAVTNNISTHRSSGVNAAVNFIDDRVSTLSRNSASLRLLEGFRENGKIEKE